jgi:hypothetical protein
MDHLLRIFDVAIFFFNYNFPVPLINIKGMSVIYIVIVTKTTEIYDDTTARLDAIVVLSRREETKGKKSLV